MWFQMRILRLFLVIFCKPQHENSFTRLLFNVRNQIFINKLLDHQSFDTKTFNCKVVQGKKINKREVLNKNVGRTFC